MKRESNNLKKILGALIVASSLALSACGSQNYQSTETTSQSQAPGTFAVAPKIDIILVEDDTGSMFEPYTQISTEVSNFITAMGAQNWDYHFAIIPLTTNTPFTQALASQHDVNWGSYWQAPYPGAPESASVADSLPSSIFTILSPQQNGGTTYSGLSAPYFDGYVQDTNINNSLNGAEPGFINLTTQIQTQIASAGFVRKDATLAVIFVGNGNDTSYVNFCKRADNVEVPCEQVAVPVCTTTQPPFIISSNGSSQCQSAQLSFNYFETQLNQFKAGVRIYSADAMETTYGGCDGGNATQGARYQELAAATGGTSYDVCSQPLTNILSDVQNNLSQVVLSYVQSYVVVDPSIAPDPTTIQVQRYIGGNSSDAVTIPQSATNGWSYIGYQTENLITSPIAMDSQTGYMIQLNGTAQLTGQDTAFVTYKYPNGTAGSASSQ
jgi:hypothetical protein